MSSLEDLRARLHAFDKETERLRMASVTPHTVYRTASTHQEPIHSLNPHPPGSNTRPLATNFLAPLRNSGNVLGDSVAALLPHAWAKSTLNGYEGAVQRFIRFCKQHNIPEQSRFPADETILAAYAASFAFQAAGSSAEKALSALKIWHDLSNAPWKGGAQLKYILKAVKNCAPQDRTRPQRPGVTPELLRILHDNLDLKAPEDAAIFAAAVTAFWCMCRLGELLGTSRRIHDPKSFPSRLSLSGSPRRGTPLYLHLPCTKTSQILGEKVRILEQFGRVDPFYALSNHLAVNRDTGPSSHLFAYRSSHGDIKCLTHETFIVRCNAVWHAHGIPRLTGHNFRIGGANTLLDNQVPSDIVKGVGRWRSGAYFKYWRKTEDKSAAYAEFITRPRSNAAPTRIRQGRLAAPVDAA